jgi:hypothetical protein
MLPCWYTGLATVGKADLTTNTLISMLLAFSEDLLTKLENELKEISKRSEDPGQRLTMSLNQIRKRLAELRQFIITNPFKTTEEEEYFFKTIKPKVYSIYLFELGYHHIESNRPFDTPARQTIYYKGELKRMRRFFKQHLFHYQYFRWNLSELDNLYFRRGIELPKLPLVEVPDLDPEFSTPLDYLYAKFIAYERLQVTILEKIKMLNRPLLAANSETVTSPKTLKWTGDAINLVELAYGIWLTGQINHGNAGIAEIIRWFEENLQVKIGRAYRRWTEIAKRKRLTTTKYMDQMRDVINKRVDDENSLSFQ